MNDKVDKTVSITLPASKSLSNRMLIIQALSNANIQIDNLSKARDTEILNDALNSEAKAINIKDAGTAMRFLTAFLALKKGRFTLSGSARMHQRPIGVLVQALNALGADITFVEKNKYPPLSIGEFEPINACQELEIDSTISSQYISAILMIAPLLPNGLFIKLKGEIASQPYIKMTLALMEQFGISFKEFSNKIKVEAGNYSSGNIHIENDWSAAGYFYNALLLSKYDTLQINGLYENSLQGDKIVHEIYEKLGVRTEFNKDGIRITKKNIALPDVLDLNFQDCPDQAQTLAVICAVLGVDLNMRGIHSLRIKETDRVLALQKELAKLNIELDDKGDSCYIHSRKLSDLPKDLKIATYDDHRMAMSFAPLCFLGYLEFDNKEVVSKSFPDFWKELNVLVNFA